VLVLIDEDERERRGRQVTATLEPVVIPFDQQRAGEAGDRGALGKITTTSERRPISRLTRSSGLVGGSLLQCAVGKA
jgi:hypothetical protein